MVPTAFILVHLLKAIGVADNIIGVIDVIEKHYKLTYLNRHYKYSTLMSTIDIQTNSFEVKRKKNTTRSRLQRRLKIRSRNEEAINSTRNETDLLAKCFLLATLWTCVSDDRKYVCGHRLPEIKKVINHRRK